MLIGIEFIIAKEFVRKLQSIIDNDLVTFNANFREFEYEFLSE